MFPLVYDPFLWLGERTGVRALRSRIVGQARGRTLEIGAGTGLNLQHYPADVDELVLVEPDPGMRSRLEGKLTSDHRRVRIVDAPAERLPFADGSIDTVVATFVLCSVEVPALAMQEIVRVLRPGGHFAFIEHVRSGSRRLARWQDRLAEPWRRFGRGCRCNRATAEVIAASGLVLGETHEASWRVMPPIVRPLLAGWAQLGGTRA
jgi:ubiquinone/menaquinone biosynthesis C-methylase UbiE